MSKPLVYLAGPITGTSYDDCTDWRQYVQEELAKYDIVGMSPMRHKQYLADAVDIAHDYPEMVLSSQRGIFARDSWDCRRVDVIFVNLLGAEKVSIGTVMEIAWAYAFHKPVVLVMEKEGNIHEHAMVKEACPFRVDTVDDGIMVVEALLTQADHY